MANYTSDYSLIAQKKIADEKKTGQTAAAVSNYNTIAKRNSTITKTPTPPTPTPQTEASGGYDYASAMMDLLKAQYDAQEKARQAKLEALYKSNNESADRQIGLYNNQANRNSRQIANLTKGGTNGAMLSSQLQNNLWRDNGINSTINTRDLANANEESASYASQATNLGNLMNGVNNIMANVGALDADSQRRLLTRLEDLYR